MSRRHCGRVANPHKLHTSSWFAAARSLPNLNLIVSARCSGASTTATSSSTSWRSRPGTAKSSRRSFPARARTWSWPAARWRSSSERRLHWSLSSAMP